MIGAIATVEISIALTDPGSCVLDADCGGAEYNSQARLGFPWEMNMEGTVECIRCHAHMESGWVPDNTDGGLQRQNWSPGEPQPSFWTGLKVEKRDKVIPVTTFRCPNCGYLESYAIPQTISDR